MTAHSNAQLREHTLAAVRAEAHHFREGFEDWLAENWHIWERFRDEAHRMRARGREHYSARTIVEYIRHETALADTSEEKFKINNDVAPDLARLYAMLPGAAEFFEKRGRT